MGAWPAAGGGHGRRAAAGNRSKIDGDTAARSCTGIVTGCSFKLVEHPRDDQNAEYLVLSTQTDLQMAPEEGVEGRQFKDQDQA